MDEHLKKEFKSIRVCRFLAMTVWNVYSLINEFPLCGSLLYYMEFCLSQLFNELVSRQNGSFGLFLTENNQNRTRELDQNLEMFVGFWNKELD